MALAQSEPHPVDRFPPTPPKSYADAVEHGDQSESPVTESFKIDEELVKETPPRLSHEPSSPRSFGQVLNDEYSGDSPRPITPFILRKTTPGSSYADAVTSTLISSRDSLDLNDRLEAGPRRDSGSDGSPRSPLRRTKMRIPSHTLDGGEREVNSSLESKLLKEKHEDTNMEASAHDIAHVKEKAVAPRDLLSQLHVDDSARSGNGLQSGQIEQIEQIYGEQSTLVQQKHGGTNGATTTTLKKPVAGRQETRKQLLNEGESRAHVGNVGVTKKKGVQQAPAKPNSEPKLVSGKASGTGRRLRWAPLKLPVQRRMQTFMVLLHTLGPMITGSIFCFFCAIPLFWPLILPYMIYILSSKAANSGSLSFRSERFRRASMWEYFAAYFPATLHRTAELPPTRKYVFGYHPHGIISHGAFAAFATEALGFSTLFPGITNTLLTLDSNFRIPVYREWILRIGLGSVSKSSCENILNRGGTNGEGMGRSVTIVVGGAPESLDSAPEAVRLVLNCRKGFVRLAIRSGADLVPVFGFGENELYEQVDGLQHPWVHWVQMLIKRILGFTIPLFHARGIFNYDVGLLPYRRPLNIVVGKPILVRAMKNPPDEYVNEIHAKYIEELLTIWETWRGTYGGESESLEIIE